MNESILRGLNAAQLAAVTSPSHVVQVLAPPGSGKTKTLTSRVAYLLAHYGYTPSNIICCTFTIKAAREMRERLRDMVGCNLESKLILGTFHSVCRKYLVGYGHLIGIPKYFGIADSNDSLALIKRIVKRLALGIEASKARSMISSHKATGGKVEDLQAKKTKSPELRELITVWLEYEESLFNSTLLDYDDLLLRCLDLLRAHPACVSNIEALLIDEFQDTNIVQFELMKLLAWKRRQVTIVGDPDQSIYSFRSAEIENLSRMRLHFPEAVVINLEQNYRSTGAVLRLAQEVIDQDTERPNKKLKATHARGTLPVLRNLPNPHEEALWIVQEIKRTLAMTGGLIQYSDISILLRSAFLSLLIEKSLASAGIPYRMVGGHRFFDRAEIRLLIDYLRAICHPDNSSALLAIVNVPSRKIGDTTIGEMQKLAETKKVSLWSIIRKVLNGELSMEKNLPKPAERGLRELISIVATGRTKMETFTPDRTPSQLLSYLISALKYEGYLKAKYKEDHEDRWENVRELLSQAAEMTPSAVAIQELPEVEGVEQGETSPSNESREVLANFLANIGLSTEIEKYDNGRDKPRVTISTIHSAKGLEWPVVFVPAVYEGSIPHSRAENTDEERRLLYVAMTRAQALLALTFPLTQSRDRGSSTLSPFLPHSLKRHLSSVGPVFSDTVLEQLAKVLRRPVPTQQDLNQTLGVLPEDGSANDDLWPEDGSQRPRPTFQSGTSAMTGASSTSGSITAYSNSIPNPQFSSSRTTMQNPAAFSTANATMGFTTANHHLKTAVVQDEVKTESHMKFKRDDSNESQKAGKGKVADHGTIRTFFNKPAAPGVYAKCSTEYGQTNTQSHPICISFSGEPELPDSSTQQSENLVPENLLSRKIERTAASIKRPRPALESTSPNRKRYVFLSSSPLRDVEAPAQMASTDHGVKSSREPVSKFFNVDARAPANPTTFDRQYPKPTLSTTRKLSAPSATANVLPRSAVSIHNTTMSRFQGNVPGAGVTTYSAKPANSTTGPTAVSLAGTGTGASRKTLGVRRTFNGWDNRKNK